MQRQSGQQTEPGGDYSQSNSGPKENVLSCSPHCLCIHRSILHPLLIICIF